MKAPSLKRQDGLRSDAETVRMIYAHACERFGKDKVHADLTRLWDMRCIMGMQGIIPFNSMASKNLGELLWVAESVCSYERIKDTK